MKKKKLKILYWISWTIGGIALILLFYGIIKTILS